MVQNKNFKYKAVLLYSMAKTEQKSLFLEAYGDGPILRVLDFLITFQDYDYSMKDIAKHAKIGYTTLKLFWQSLLERKIVKQTRTVGKAKMYKLNTENQEVQAFMKFYWKVTDSKTNSLEEQYAKVIVQR